MRGKIVRAKKSNCKRKNQFGKRFPEMWACASFYIWSGSRVLLSFWGGFAKSLSNPAPKAKKTSIFCGRESRFISAMFYVCQLRVFCWLVFKRHESYNGKFIFGYTHCHHSGAAIPRAEVIFAQAKPAGSVPWVTYYHWPRVQISTLDTLQNRSLRTHPYLLLHQIHLRVWTPNEIDHFGRRSNQNSIRSLLPAIWQIFKKGFTSFRNCLIKSKENKWWLLDGKNTFL